MKNYKFLSNALINIQDIKKEIPLETNIYRILKLLIKNNKIKKLKSGLYATLNPLNGDIFANKYEIATAIYKDSVIAYHSALEFHGIANQVYTNVEVISKNEYSSIIIEDYEYQFFKKNCEFGILEIEQNSRIKVTDLERTIIDCVDRLYLSGGIEEVCMAISAITYCNEDKIKKYLKLYNIKLLYKKVGYLFSLIKPKYLSNNFYSFCKENMSNRIDDIRENKLLPYVLDKEWKIYVPKTIINKEN